jgi:hypothetical protein
MSLFQETIGDRTHRHVYIIFFLGFLLACAGVILNAWILKTLLADTTSNSSLLVSLDTIGLILVPLGLFLMGYAFLVK